MSALLCPACQKTVQSTFQTKDINRRISDEVFDYYRCSNCGLIFLHPLPNDLGSYYTNDYYQVPPTLEVLEASAEEEKYRIELVKRFVPNGRLLEIGPSYGSFAYLAKKRGYDVEVIEMDAQCCEFISSELGIRAIQSDNPSETLRSLGTYDAIVMWQVIEHVPNPWQLLKTISEHLTPGGVLILSTPNPRALQFKLMGKRWAHLDVPRHLQLIPISVLNSYGGTIGIKPVFTTTRDVETTRHNIFGWKKSLMNWMGVSVSESSAYPVATATLNFKPSTSVKYKLSRFMLRSLVGLISIVLSPIERTDLRGSSYTAVLQKLP